MEKLWLFGLFSGDKADNIDVWMIKITIKANQIDVDVLLISNVDNIQKPYFSLKSGFSIILLVCEFYPHEQTWWKTLGCAAHTSHVLKCEVDIANFQVVAIILCIMHPVFYTPLKKHFHPVITRC